MSENTIRTMIVMPINELEGVIALGSRQDSLFSNQLVNVAMSVLHDRLSTKEFLEFCATL